MYNDFFESPVGFYSAFPNIVLLIVILNLHFAPYLNKVSKETPPVLLYCVDVTIIIFRLSCADSV